MIFIYPNTLSTFDGHRETALANGYIEIENFIYEDLRLTKKKWENGEIVDNPDYVDPIEIDEPEEEHIPTTQELIERIEQNATEAFLAKVESEQMLTDMEIRLLILEAGQ